MNTEIEKPALHLTLFTDYICPFCYIGDLRLQHLRKYYNVLVNFRFVEIHPETPQQGTTVDALDYSAEKWKGMMASLVEMAEAEGISLAPVSLLANSRRALQLAEAAKKEGRDVFYKLNQSLYEAYFLKGKNIGDLDVLKTVAASCKLTQSVLERAWDDPEINDTLDLNMQMALKAGVTATPTFFIGKQRLTGAVSVDNLFQAAELSVKDRDQSE